MHVPTFGDAPQPLRCMSQRLETHHSYYDACPSVWRGTAAATMHVQTFGDAPQPLRLMSKRLDRHLSHYGACLNDWMPGVEITPQIKTFRAIAKRNFRFGDSKVFFPLTPTLSAREREHSGRSSKRARRLGSSQAGHEFSLSLRERAGVRGNGSSWHPTPIDSEMTFGNQSNGVQPSSAMAFPAIHPVVHAD
jgi:hypothetical protein